MTGYSVPEAAAGGGGGGGTAGGGGRTPIKLVVGEEEFNAYLEKRVGNLLASAGG